MGSSKAGDAAQPLVFAILANLTPPDIEIQLFDDRIENILFDVETDLAVITIGVFTAMRAYQIAKEYKKRNVHVIMGGPHATLASQEVSFHADSVVIGDAELIWPEIICDLLKNQLKPFYKSSALTSIFSTTFNRSVFDNKKYLPINIVQWGRGCIKSCDFCSINAFYGKKQFHRPIDEVAAEIETLNKNFIFFADDNLLYNNSKTKEFLINLSKLNIKYSCQISIDVANNEKLVKLLAKSGCAVVIIGFETLNSANLKQMNKRWFSVQKYEKAIQLFRDNGIMVYGTFVFGYDGDSLDSFKYTLDFTLKNKLLLANFNPLTPIPGTNLYIRLMKEKRMIYDKWWLEPDYMYGKATFYPKNISPDELAEGCFMARKKFNTFKNIFNRCLDKKANANSLTNLKIFLIGNYVSRRAIYNKQWSLLSKS